MKQLPSSTLAKGQILINRKTGRYVLVCFVGTTNVMVRIFRDPSSVSLFKGDVWVHERRSQLRWKAPRTLANPSFYTPVPLVDVLNAGRKITMLENTRGSWTDAYTVQSTFQSESLNRVRKVRTR